MAALGPAMTRGDGRERFELGLDVIINGLLATPTEGRLTATRSPRSSSTGPRRGLEELS